MYFFDGTPVMTYGNIPSPSHNRFVPLESAADFTPSNLKELRLNSTMIQWSEVGILLVQFLGQSLQLSEHQ